MRTKRSIVLMADGLLVAALGMPPALGQEQPQGQDEQAQAAEELRLTREMINNERQALAPALWTSLQARCSASGPCTVSTEEQRRRLGTGS